MLDQSQPDYEQPSRGQPPAKPPALRRGLRSEKAQALVVIVISFLALLAFVGVVTDIGSIYITYTQLKRAVDSAAVAAAINIKSAGSEQVRRDRITEAARDMLSLHHITDISTLEVYLCGDAGSPQPFVEICPDEDEGEPPRKLAWVQASENIPVYFLGIFGVQSMPFTAGAVGEAATLDLVLVIDTSESMGNITQEGSGQPADNFDPTACNASNNCQPLLDAKNAAKSLIAQLYDGIDQVGIVTFDYEARVEVNLTTDISVAVDAAIDNIVLHDDAPAGLIDWWVFNNTPCEVTFNPVFPDDRDGDGFDADADSCTPIPGTLWEKPNPDDCTTWIPCDLDGQYDVFDWDGDHVWGEAEDNIEPPSFSLVPPSYDSTAIISTCSGCGLRRGAQILASGGRPNGVWVMVFFSDGVVNMSDTATSWSEIPAIYDFGFCGLSPTGFTFWGNNCQDLNTDWSAGRFCMDDDPTECPPDTTYTISSGPYSVEDYAYDMVDTAALLESANPDEPPGEDIIIYSIGFGPYVGGRAESLLRYMANVGDEGSRANDPCEGVASHVNCGNYYYAPNAAYLAQIFESIAGQIFTKVSY